MKTHRPNPASMEYHLYNFFKDLYLLWIYYLLFQWLFNQYVIPYFLLSTLIRVHNFRWENVIKQIFNITHHWEFYLVSKRLQDISTPNLNSVLFQPRIHKYLKSSWLKSSRLKCMRQRVIRRELKIERYVLTKVKSPPFFWSFCDDF